MVAGAVLAAAFALVRLVVGVEARHEVPPLLGDGLQLKGRPAGGVVGPECLPKDLLYGSLGFLWTQSGMMVL